jgi:hypothetical protein
MVNLATLSILKHLRRPDAAVNDVLANGLVASMTLHGVALAKVTGNLPGTVALAG